MLTEEQLNHVVTHPDDVSHQVVAMAKELLAYRAAFARPYAV
ncbi:hypothetical protein WDV93_17645 [Pantoea ananatis]